MITFPTLSTSDMNAISRAIANRGPARVLPLEDGTFEVPSATDATQVYVVTPHTEQDDVLSCNCPAGQHDRPCWHVWAVRYAEARRVEQIARESAKAARAAARQERRAA